MEEFNSLEKVKELFNEIGYFGNENCFFVAFKDYAASTGLVGGAVGGMVNGMEYPYDGLLINKNENGICMIFLKTEGVAFTINLSKLKLAKNDYVFVKNEDIKNITVKKYALLNSSKKKMKI